MITFFGWLIGKAMAFAGSGIVGKALDIYNKAQDSNVRLAEVDATTGVAIHAQATAAAVQLQTQKMSWPVFWIIISLMMAAPVITLLGVTFYNFLWWEHGMFPQPWAIAAYPPSVAPWVQMSIEWLYNPVGVPGTIASAWLAGRATGRR